MQDHYEVQNGSNVMMEEAMRSSVEALEKPADVSSWAQRFAQRRRTSHEPHVDIEAENVKWAAEMLDALWAMFHAAVGEVNIALEQSGSPDRVTVGQTECEYRMSMADSTGGEREIHVFANLCVMRGHISGGAVISTNWTRATIRLLPSADHGQLHWMVPAADTQFTPRIVADLFLSVFSDDPTGTLRLSKFFTVDS